MGCGCGVEDGGEEIVGERRESGGEEGSHGRLPIARVGCEKGCGQCFSRLLVLRFGAEQLKNGDEEKLSYLCKSRSLGYVL